MQKSDKYFEDLILDDFSGNLSEEGSRELLVWLEQGEHKQLFKKYIGELYAISCSQANENIDVTKAGNKIFRRLQARRKLSRVLSYAACLLVILTTSLLSYRYINFDEIQSTEVDAPMASLSGRQAILSVGNERQVVLDGSQKTLLSSKRNISVVLKDSNRIEYSGTADRLSADSVPIHTLKVPQGSEFHLTLSDGTRIWINAASELTYPECFGEGKREVILSGEAYFEVAPDAQSPFIGKTRDMDLRVLGTSFNVKAYGEESYVVTTLVTGKISQHYASGENIVLSPRKQSVYDCKKNKSGYVR